MSEDSDEHEREAIAQPSPSLREFLNADTSSGERLAKGIHHISGDSSQPGELGGKLFESSVEGSKALWYHTNGDALYGAMWSEKIENQGEDAYPLLVVSRKDSVVVGSVFDGLGGSGASRIDWTNGQSVSHAWEAARIARSSLSRHLATKQGLRNLSNIGASTFPRSVKDQLIQRASGLHQIQSGLSSSLSRILPTTIAGFVIRLRGVQEVEAFWAGDSRTYLLDTQRGLQVLTRDDAEDMDAFESLNLDPPLTNVICADRPFELNSRTVKVTAPMLVLCATDGCFNYWPTPANFEFEILDAIIKASSWENALASLRTSIGAVTKDDTSLAIAAIGFKNFKSLQSALATRHQELYQMTYVPLAEIKNSGGSREDFEEYRIATWRSYKHDYEIMLEVPS
jgi:hypothetical protein